MKKNDLKRYSLQTNENKYNKNKSTRNVSRKNTKKHFKYTLNEHSDRSIYFVFRYNVLKRKFSKSLDIMYRNEINLITLPIKIYYLQINNLPKSIRRI